MACPHQTPAVESSRWIGFERRPVSQPAGLWLVGRLWRPVVVTPVGDPLSTRRGEAWKGMSASARPLPSPPLSLFVIGADHPPQPPTHVPRATGCDAEATHGLCAHLKRWPRRQLGGVPSACTSRGRGKARREGAAAPDPTPDRATGGAASFRPSLWSFASAPLWEGRGRRGGAAGPVTTPLCSRAFDSITYPRISITLQTKRKVGRLGGSESARGSSALLSGPRMDCPAGAGMRHECPQCELCATSVRHVSALHWH